MAMMMMKGYMVGIVDSYFLSLYIHIIGWLIGPYLLLLGGGFKLECFFWPVRGSMVNPGPNDSIIIIIHSEE